MFHNAGVKSELFKIPDKRMLLRSGRVYLLWRKETQRDQSYPKKTSMHSHALGVGLESPQKGTD